MTTQDAVNPIESLDTWTEFVEGKNKVHASHATDREGEGRWGGPSPGFHLYQACRVLRVGGLSAVFLGLSYPSYMCIGGEGPLAAFQTGKL